GAGAGCVRKELIPATQKLKHSAISKQIRIFPPALFLSDCHDVVENRSFVSTPGRTLRLPSTRPNDPGKLKRLGVARARQTGQVSPWFELKFLKEKSGGMYKSKKMRSAGAASLFVMTLLFAMPQAAWSQANCRNTGSFEAWLANFKKEAAAKG